MRNKWESETLHIENVHSIVLYILRNSEGWDFLQLCYALGWSLGAKSLYGMILDFLSIEDIHTSRIIRMFLTARAS